MKNELRIIGSLWFAAALLLGYMVWFDFAHGRDHVPHHRPTQGCPVVHAIQVEMDRAQHDGDRHMYDVLEGLLRAAK
jgi:hypothetical protein